MSTRMELDQVVYGLDPYITASVESKPPENDIYKDSYVTLLSQLAVLLRDPPTRENTLFQSNLQHIVNATAKLLPLVEESLARDVILELLKVLINGVADVERNRDVVSNNKELWLAIISHLKEHFDDDEVNERIFMMIQNLIIDDQNGELTKKIQWIWKDVLWYLQYNDENEGATEVLTLLVSRGVEGVTTEMVHLSIKKLSGLLEKYKTKDFITDDDGTDELIVNYSRILESLTLDLGLKFEEQIEDKLQSLLIQTLHTVREWELPNKLKFERSIYAAIGNISSNYTAKNHLSYPIDDEKNGYVISAVCLIIANSIDSNATRDLILETHPQLIALLMTKVQYLTDALLFQGFLQLLKHTITLETHTQLFSDFRELTLLVDSVVSNSRYYGNLSPLFASVLKKLLVVMNKEHFTQFLQIESLNQFEDDSVGLLILNKCIIYNINDSLRQQLTKRAMSLTNGQIEATTLFELTKTIGLLARHEPDLLIKQYRNELVVLLETVLKMDETMGVGMAVKNNTKFAAGMLYEKAAGDEQLETLCKELLS